LKVSGKIATIIIRTFLHLVCKVDRKELKKIPRKGPFLVAFNHINFLEVPLIFVDLYPRKVHGIAKKETWDNSFFSWLADMWETISVDREGFSASTFRQVKKFLKNGSFVIIAPEGTRTGDGKLKEAHPGIITMALQTDIPIIPIVHYGGEIFWDRIKMLKRTRFTYKVGNPIILKKAKRITQEIRRDMVDQLMYRMAKLLPEKYRGVYSEISKINNEFVEDIEFNEIRH
jgi:1-acyl-sn-glycerol-3-phosphate acyltransferase